MARDKGKGKDRETIKINRLWYYITHKKSPANLYLIGKAAELSDSIYCELENAN
ncbi:hypothetical protein HII17_08700 [Thalassotalea sp. M1531]|uniref:Uncharacterized protein n=1 Tax=Thalassotalea algicola TaxID=2716224 RepID=A0A7Y0Q6Q4_9GAMM|nr:hypothetical protein [Thalassotalea algicola]NMP31638.1 hypothetical protein [Thalassotalea algicola]